MNKDRLLVILIIVMLIAGIVCLGYSIFGEKQDGNHPLPIALGWICVANSLIIVRNRKKRSDKALPAGFAGCANKNKK